MGLRKTFKQLPRLRQRQTLCSLFSPLSTHILPAALPCAATSLSIVRVRLLRDMCFEVTVLAVGVSVALGHPL